jgi:hypothetical protein
VGVEALKSLWKGPHFQRGSISPSLAIVSQSGQSGIAQANRIALALLCRLYDAFGDDFADQGVLSSVMKIIPARCVKRLAYEAGRFVIEIEFI